MAMSSDVPLVDGYSARSTRIEDWLSDRPDDTVRAYHHAVSPGFFSTLDIDLSAGRDFSWFDNREAPRVVVVSRKMAERSWPGENPLGKRISFSGSDGPWRSIVGVVEDIRYRNLVADTVSTSDDPDVYSPLAQEPTRNLGIVIDASGTTVSLESVRAEIRAMDAAIPVYAVRAMADVLDEQLALPRFAASLLGLFGGVALLLAAGGLYGLLAHLVAQRSREIGIQMALGATGAQISRRIVRQGLVLSGAGILFGLAASVAFGRFLESRLFEVSGNGSLDARNLRASPPRRRDRGLLSSRAARHPSRPCGRLAATVGVVPDLQSVEGVCSTRKVTWYIRNRRKVQIRLRHRVPSGRNRSVPSRGLPTHRNGLSRTDESLPAGKAPA